MELAIQSRQIVPFRVDERAEQVREDEKLEMSAPLVLRFF